MVGVRARGAWFTGERTGVKGALHFYLSLVLFSSGRLDLTEALCLTLTGRFVGGVALGDAHLRRHRHIPVRDSGCSPVHRRAVRGWRHERLGQLA